MRGRHAPKPKRPDPPPFALPDSHIWGLYGWVDGEAGDTVFRHGRTCSGHPCCRPAKAVERDTRNKSGYDDMGAGMTEGVPALSAGEKARSLANLSST